MSRLTYHDLTPNVPDSGFTIRAASNGFASATTAPIQVINPPARLAVTALPPASITPTQSLSLTVAVEDALGILAADYNGIVTLTLAGKQRGKKLRGTLSVNAVNGVATFSGLTLGRGCKGDAFQIQVTTSGRAGTTIGPTDVSSPARIPHPSRSRGTRVRA